MKTGKKKARPQEFASEELVRKTAKKTAIKRDRRISIYNPVDDDDDLLEIDNLFEYDPDLIDEEGDEDSNY